MTTYTATDVQIKDLIYVRRSNEKKARVGLVMDIIEQTFGEYIFLIAIVAFSKTTEVVNLSTAEIALDYRSN